MIKFFAMIALLLTSPAFANEANIYLGGRYNCEFDSKPSFVKTSGPFQLEIQQKGMQSRTRVAKLTSVDQFELQASEFSGATFHAIEANLSIKKNTEIAYVYLTGDKAQTTHLELSLAFRTEPELYAFDRLKCTGESIMKKVPIVQLDCATTDLIKQTLTPIHVRFALANMGEPHDFLILKYDGEPSLQTPLEVLPKSSYFSSLNDNLSGSVRRDYVLLAGAPQDLFVSHLRIDRPSLTRGIAWLESGSKEVPETRRSVNCAVKGNVVGSFQERPH